MIDAVEGDRDVGPVQEVGWGRRSHIDHVPGELLSPTRLHGREDHMLMSVVWVGWWVDEVPALLQQVEDHVSFLATGDGEE